MILLLMLIMPGAVSAQTAADSSAIRATALDYVDGWYTADAERMERALHPELAKRIIRTNAQGKSSLDQMGAMRLVQYTRGGGGKNTPPAEQIRNVAILDIYQNVASVRAEMSGWIDYMHLGKWDGRWVIVNVLWERKPEPSK
jgi:hypothetical protein